MKKVSKGQLVGEDSSMINKALLQKLKRNIVKKLSPLVQHQP